MPDTKTTQRIALFLLASASVLASVEGCAHRRQSYYPSDVASPNPGVHVRAPFVDVQVKGRPKSDREERAARREDDREDEDRD